MENRLEKVRKNHQKGYNCAQAVACAFCEEVGIDEETMFKLSEGFGLGMGGMDGVCGAVSAAVLLNGLKNSTAHLEHPDSKKDTYALSKLITKEFMEKNQSILCKDLKGVETKKVLRSCDGCIEDATKIIEKYL